MKKINSALLIQLFLIVLYAYLPGNAQAQDCKFQKDFKIQNGSEKTIVKMTKQYKGFAITKFETQKEKPDSLDVFYAIHIDALIQLANIYNDVMLDSTIFTLGFENEEKIRLVLNEKEFIKKVPMTLTIASHEFTNYFKITKEQLSLLQNTNLQFWGLKLYLTNLKDMTTYNYYVDSPSKEEDKERIMLMANCIISR